MDFVRSLTLGNVISESLETLEGLFPLYFYRDEFRQNSGGPGKFRGGLGVVREYQSYSEGVISLLGERSFIPPSGIFSGESGSAAHWDFVHHGKVVPISPKFGSKVNMAPFTTEDIIRSSTQGGGGYGDPLERQPAMVRSDVLDGKVSLEQAGLSYGVILVGDALEVDQEGTLRERKKMAGRPAAVAEFSANSPERENN